MTNPSYLTIPEVCDLLRISRATYYRMVKAGALHPRKVGTGVNGKVLILRAEVDAMLKG